MIHSKKFYTILSLVLGLFVMISCGDTAKTVSDKASDAVEAAGDATKKAANAVKKTAGNAADAVKETAGNAADAVKDAVTDKSGPEYTSAYVCPMHCKGSGSATAGTCPVCKMDYVANAHAGHNHDGHNH